jgi:hypothetical protein
LCPGFNIDFCCPLRQFFAGDNREDAAVVSRFECFDDQDADTEIGRQRKAALRRKWMVNGVAG